MLDAMDELRIEITAESKKADDKIDDLCNKIEKLASSLGSLNGKKPTGLQDFQKATEGVSKVATDLASKYKDLGKGFELKGSTQYLQKQVDNLSNALVRATLKKNELEMSGSTGGQMYEYAVRDVIKYENQIESLKNQLASIGETKLSPELELKLSNLEQAESQIKEIVEETPKVVEVSADSLGYNQQAIEFVENYSERAKASVQSLTEKLSELTVPEVRTDNIDKLTASIEKTEAKLEELRNKLSNAIVMGTVTESVDDSGYVRLQEQIALAEKQLEAFRAKKAEAESAPSAGLDSFQSKISKIGASLSKVTSGFTRFASGIKSVIAKIASLGKSMFGLNKNTKGLNNSFSGGLKKILAYGFGIRGVYALFNKLRSAVKEGMKNLVQFSSETNASVSLLNNSFAQLKNASSAMTAPLLNALAPALNTIIQWCVKATNAVNQLISALTGKSTWIKAKTLTDDYASSLDNANSSAKKLYSTTLGIDELNINSGETDTSGGSGGTSAGDMFEYEDITAKWTNIADWLKSMWEDADFTELGEKIGEMLTNALNSIPWETVYEGARNFGKGLATFLNGLISPELFGTVGQTIAGALNVAVYSALSFHETFEGYELGTSISTAINEFFETFDFESLAETLNLWVDDLEDIISGAISSLEKDKIIEGLEGFFTNLEIDTIAVIVGIITIKSVGKIVFGGSIAKYLVLGLAGKITNIITGAFSYASTLLSGLSFSNIITVILHGLSSMLGWINPGMIGELGIRLEDLLRGTFLDTSTWEGLPKEIDDAVTGAIDSIGSFIGDAILGLWEVLKYTVSKIFNWDETNGIFEDARKNFEKGGLYIVLGIGEGIIGALSSLLEPLKNIFELIWEGICDLFGIHSPAKEMKPLGEYILLGIIEGFKNKINEFTKAMKDWWDRSVAPWFTKEKWLNTFDNIKKALKTEFNAIVSQWKTDISDWWDRSVAPWFTKEKWSGILSEIPSSFKRAFKNAINGAIELFNKFIGWINEKMNFSWNGIKIAGKQVVDPGSVQLFKIPTIPQFATGAVVNKPTFGMFGEDGAEVIVPLEKNTGWINRVAEQIDMALSGSGTSDELLREQNELLCQQNELLRKILNKNVSVKIGDRQIAEAGIRGRERMGYSFT